MENMKENFMTIEKRALIVWYYQCKRFTPVCISVITKVDIKVIKDILRENCYEYENEERIQIAAERFQRKMNATTYGVKVGASYGRW